MRGKTRKATFNLPDDILTAMDEVMAHGNVKSKNAMVEQALRKELKELRKKERQKRWQEGAKDTALLKDIAEVEADFKTADAETARRIG